MRIKENSWLITKPVAHRGLWGENIVENSITAYKNAVKHGYPIEIDLFLTTDDVLVSFHDDSLKRMTGENGFIFNKSLAELKKLRLNRTEEQIPTFDQVLEICENKVPLLIEIKNQPNKLVVDKVVERLKSYKGEFAIQSFNPLYIKRVKKLAPEFIRGILADTFNLDKSRLVRFIVRKMPLNCMCKPDFISMNYKSLPLKIRKVKNRPLIAWTVTSQDTADKIKPYCQNIIFENFIPKE